MGLRHLVPYTGVLPLFPKNSWKCVRRNLCVLQCAAVCCSVLSWYYSCFSSTTLQRSITANPTWGDIFECCFKAQSSKLERFFSLKSGKRGVRALSFELSKLSLQVGLAFPPTWRIRHWVGDGIFFGHSTSRYSLFSAEMRGTTSGSSTSFCRRIAGRVGCGSFYVIAANCPPPY